MECWTQETDMHWKNSICSWIAGTVFIVRGVQKACQMWQEMLCKYVYSRWPYATLWHLIYYTLHNKSMLYFLVSGTNFPLTLALDQTCVRRWTLARGEGRPCCLLSQLWPAAPTTAGHWGNEQTGQGTGRCLGSGCGQWEVEEGETELCMLLTRSHILRGSVLYVTLWKVH